jgi:hypothetical protein
VRRDHGPIVLIVPIVLSVPNISSRIRTSR